MLGSNQRRYPTIKKGGARMELRLPFTTNLCSDHKPAWCYRIRYRRRYHKPPESINSNDPGTGRLPPVTYR